MAVKIKQGDAVSVPVKLELNEEALNPAEVEQAEFYIGGYRKLYPGEVAYDETEGCFYCLL